MKYRTPYTEEEKSKIIEFYKNNGLAKTRKEYNVSYSAIKSWINPDFLLKQRQHLKNNYNKYKNEPKTLEKRKIKGKKYYESHKEEWSQYGKLYYQNNKEHIQQKIKEYSQKNKEQLREMYRLHGHKKRQTDPIFKLKSNLRCRLNIALRDQKAYKQDRTFNLAGCTPKELKLYIESKFLSGMTWDNWGKWHIDHIIPCANFDLTKLEEQQKCFHYTNLQPLWAQDNLAKGTLLSTKTLGVITCASQKKSFACEAQQMYDNSVLFRTLRDCVQNKYNEYIILSAFYGVLKPHQIIEPYNDTVMFLQSGVKERNPNVKVLSAEEKKQWAKKVYMDFKWYQYTEIHFYIGKYYSAYLKPYFKDYKNVFFHNLNSGIGNIVNDTNQELTQELNNELDVEKETANTVN